MNDDEKDDSLDTPESIADDSAAPAGDDSFSARETESADQELAQLIEVDTAAPPVIRNPAHLTLVGSSDDDPPDWPDF